MCKPSPNAPGCCTPGHHPQPTARPGQADTSPSTGTSLRTPLPAFLPCSPCYSTILHPPELFYIGDLSGAGGEKWMKIKFLASSEELCPADSLGFVCSSLVSEELPTFQRERACFGCCGLALCQPSFQHTGAAAGFCVPALLCFQMPMKFPPLILHGGACAPQKSSRMGGIRLLPGTGLATALQPLGVCKM